MVPFKISDEAVEQLKSLIARTPEARPEHGIRIYISGLSHFGPEWSLTLDTYNESTDECCEFDGLRIMIERDLLEAVGGIDVQYEALDDEDGGGFLITAVDPEIQALYSGGCGGGCHGGCGGCGGGCHGGCGGCGGGCHGGCNCGDCDDCDDDCSCHHE